MKIARESDGKVFERHVGQRVKCYYGSSKGVYRVIKTLRKVSPLVAETGTLVSFEPLPRCPHCGRERRDPAGEISGAYILARAP